MKMKEVCRQTNLTERTIRFYVERELISPNIEIINGRKYFDYSDENIKQLLTIAELRKLCFSVDDIVVIQDHPEEINNILSKHHDQLLEEVIKKNDIIAAIANMKTSKIANAEQLVASLSDVSSHYSLPPFDINPDFSKFDSETKEEKESALLDFLAAQKIRNRIHDFLRPLSKIAMWSAAVVVLIVIVIALSGIPRTINKEYSAVQFRVNDTVYSENIKVTVKGKLYKRLFADPKFAGSIVIDPFDYTKTSELIDVTFNRSIREGWGNLQYSSYYDGKPHIESLGSIWMSGKFDTITIWVYEPLEGDKKSTTDLIISAPAHSRPEALQIVEQLSHYSEQHKSMNDA